MTQSDFWSEELPANHLVLQAYAKDLTTQEVTLHLPMLEFLISLNPSGVYGKMCQVSSVQAAEGILEPSLGRWANSAMGGPTGCLMLITSESHKDADECLLSDVLEVGNLPQKYYLSPKACQGILNRAERRKKVLPDMLKAALDNIVVPSKRFAFIFNLKISF